MDEVKDGEAAVTDEDISTLVARLSRKHRSGGRVIERAAIMAEGGNSAAILSWLAEHGWEPEADAAPTTDRGGMGLHGMRREAERGRAQAQAPRRYISPAPGDDA
jgi:O-methyltransferase involved in polyketide biosynthesis